MDYQGKLLEFRLGVSSVYSSLCYLAAKTGHAEGMIQWLSCSARRRDLTWVLLINKLLELSVGLFPFLKWGKLFCIFVVEDKSPLLVRHLENR